MSPFLIAILVICVLCIILVNAGIIKLSGSVYYYPGTDDNGSDDSEHYANYRRNGFNKY